MPDDADWNEASGAGSATMPGGGRRRGWLRGWEALGTAPVAGYSAAGGSAVSLIILSLENHSRGTSTN